MSNTDNSQERTNALRLKTIQILEDLSETAKKLGLPLPFGPLEPLDTYRQMLIKNTFKLLVVGEAKRGKSTFVNALMGRDLLPTDSDIATNQVFYVRHMPQEAYRLRFEDGSELPITSKDLTRYGSQTAMDHVENAENEAMPDLRMIRWIEVEGAFTFIPEELCILDTPGLGSIYRDHEATTRRFVLLADAVIFVLDSTQLAGKPDIDFLREILTVTNHIFFIQTKIDLLIPEQWQEILQRHRTILQEAFPDQLPNPQVWPIDSLLLHKSTRAHDKYDIRSHHRELTVALQNFILHVSGWAHTADALSSAAGYYGRVHQRIIDEKAAFLKNSQEQQKLKRQRDEMKRTFDASWGVNGTERKELLTNIKRLFDLARREFEHAIRRNGEIETSIRKRIDTIKTVKEAKAMASSLVDEVESQAMLQWEEVCAEVGKQCAQLLEPFQKEVTGFYTSSPSLDNEIPVHLTADDGMWTQIKNTRGDIMLVSMIGGLGIGALSLLFPPAIAFLAPLLPSVPLIGLLTGWRRAGETEAERGKQQLRQHLGEVMDVIRESFLGVNLAKNQYSHVEEFFENRKMILTDVIDQIAQQKSADYQAYINTLKQADGESLTDEQQQSALREVQTKLVAWIKLGTALKEARAELNALESSMMRRGTDAK